MTKSDIVVSVPSIKEFNNVFKNNNNEIIDSLKKIEKIFEDMPYILNTPNSNKVIPNFLEYVSDREKYVIENGEHYEKFLDATIENYTNFVNEISIKVGGNE